MPRLQPQTLALCLVTLAIITVANLRGVREVGALFIVALPPLKKPTPPTLAPAPAESAAPKPKPAAPQLSTAVLSLDECPPRRLEDVRPLGTLGQDVERSPPTVP